MKVTGTGWLIQWQYYQEKYSPADLERVKAALAPADQQELFGRAVLPVSWVDLGAIMSFMLAADRLLAKGDKGLIGDVMRYKAQKEFTGIYRFFLSLASPKTIMRRASVIWKKMYSEGEAVVLNETKTSIDIKVTELKTQPPYHDLSVVAYAEEVMRIAGWQNPRGEIKKSPRLGHDHMLIHYTWD
ncbi:MAG: hypothetical protein AB1439_01510 [candidate division FCPU426 bacterium]